MAKKSNKKRSDGRIAVQVYLGLVDGKRKYKTVYGTTQKEADQKAEELKAKLRKGFDIEKENDSFSKWAEMWLTQKSIEIGTSQKESYKGSIDKLNEYIGNYALKSIRTFDIQSIINDYYIENPTTKKPSSKRLLELIKNTAVQIFQFAIENRVLDFNPAVSVKIPKNAVQSSRRALTYDERSWIINTPHRMQTAAMIMMFAGLRKGELIPLTWKDVDLNNGTISVNKAVEMIDRKPRVKSTKTQAGIRTIYIPDILKNYLANQKKDNILVCPSLNGNMFTKDSFRSSWESYLNEIDIKFGYHPQKQSKHDPRFHGRTIPNITPHMLRHTFCSMMYESGVDVMSAKNQMGHADIQTTLNIYTHISSEHTAKEMQKMNMKNEECKSDASQQA
jgi:integrase